MNYLIRHASAIIPQLGPIQSRLIQSRLNLPIASLQIFFFFCFSFFFFLLLLLLNVVEFVRLFCDSNRWMRFLLILILRLMQILPLSFMCQWNLRSFLIGVMRSNGFELRFNADSVRTETIWNWNWSGDGFDWIESVRQRPDSLFDEGSIGWIDHSSTDFLIELFQSIKAVTDGNVRLRFG